MDIRRILSRNIFWNWLGMTCDAVAAFLVMPYLIRFLGEGRFGLWVLVGSFTSYFGLLDLGVRGSVGRFVAYYRAGNDAAGVNSVFSTAAAITMAVGGLIVLLIPAVLSLFFTVIDVPQSQVDEVRTALILVCLNLSLGFPLSLFDGALWAAQRFDILNAIDIPATLLRVGLTLFLVGQGGGLVALASTTLVVTLLSGTVKALASRPEFPTLAIGPRHLRRETARELIRFGLGNLVLTVSRLTRLQMSPMLIGSLMGLSTVTVYSIARRLLDYGERVVVSATGVLTPLATQFHAQNDHERQLALLMDGGRFCTAIALGLLGGSLLLAQPLFALWVGPNFAHAALLANILIAGEVGSLSQSLTGNVQLGAGRVRSLAILAVAELVLGGLLIAVLVRPLGLLGVCLALAVAGGICRGLGMMVLGCRAAGISLAGYVRYAVLPPLICIGPPTALMAVIVAQLPPTRWASLTLEAVAFIALGGVACLPLLGRDRLRLLAGFIRSMIGGQTPAQFEETT